MSSEWPNVVNLNEVEYEERFEVAPYLGQAGGFSKALGARQLGFHLGEIAPGSFGCPYHFHHGEEELFLIWKGKLMLRQCGRYRELVEGDLVVFPTGPEGAHQFFNHGDEPAVVFALSTRAPLEVCEYPDSGKVMTRAAGKVFRAEDAVPYLTGEEDPGKAWPEGVREGTRRLEARALGPENAPDLMALLGSFDGCEGCWCWDHLIPHADLEVVGETARVATEKAAREGTRGGVLAYLDGEAVGWCAVDPRRRVPGHDCVDAHERPQDWAIHCLLVRPEARGLRLTETMVASAVLEARAAGVERIEGYARAEGEGAATHAFLPSPGVFRRLGFQAAESPDPYYSRWVKALAPPVSG